MKMNLKKKPTESVPVRTCEKFMIFIGQGMVSMERALIEFKIAITLRQSK